MLNSFVRIIAPGVLACILLTGCETAPAWYYKRDISPELREIVLNTDIRKSDFRARQLEVDKKTALVVLDPFVVTWLEGYIPMWSLGYMPDDHTEIDTSQRIVMVQVRPIMGFLEEGYLPSGWQPIDRIDAQRDGVLCQAVDVRRRPITTPSGEYYPNQGFYGFEPGCFAPAGKVRLLVWRSESSTEVPVSQVLQRDLAENFRIFDAVMAELKAIR